MNDWEKLWVTHRPFLVSFAFRMTGSLAEAEDLVQDTFMQSTWTNPRDLENPKAWLTKVCSNKCLDHLKSAYKKREAYIGPWLPDAIPDGLQFFETASVDASPEKQLLLTESLTTTFLLMAERLSPEERVVYLLTEVFEYSFKDVSLFLDKSEDSCRKLAQRARESIVSQRVKYYNTENAERLIADLFEYAKRGDEARIKAMLDDNSEFWSDGGGRIAASLRVLTHKNQIASFFKFIGTSPVFDHSEYKVEYSLINHRPGVIISKKLESGLWQFETLMNFEFNHGKVAKVYAQRNPDKLRSLMKEDLFSRS